MPAASGVHLHIHVPVTGSAGEAGDDHSYVFVSLMMMNPAPLHFAGSPRFVNVMITGSPFLQSVPLRLQSTLPLSHRRPKRPMPRMTRPVIPPAMSTSE